MENKEIKSVIKAIISKHVRQSGIWIRGVILFVLASGAYMPTIIINGGLSVPLYMIVTLATTGLFLLLWFAIFNRKRKLTELTVSEKEIVGSYTGFIPFAKIMLRMPIEKVDNVAAVNSIFDFFTGKKIRIASASGVIKIRYVLNADEVVAFISAAIEQAKKRQAFMGQSTPQNDMAESLKKLAELRDSGIITEEEFNQKKSELLSKM